MAVEKKMVRAWMQWHTHTCIYLCNMPKKEEGFRSLGKCAKLWENVVWGGGDTGLRGGGLYETYGHKLGWVWDHFNKQLDSPCPCDWGLFNFFDFNFYVSAIGKY